MAGLHATHQLPHEDEHIKSFAPGDRIEARYGGGDAYYPGTVGFIHADTLSCDIVYDDGDGEAGVPFALIRKRGESGQGGQGASPATNAAASPFAVGVEVEIRSFQGGWKLGTVAGIREEGSFDVQMADGTMEKGVPPSLVRLKEAAAAATAAVGSAADSSSNPVTAGRQDEATGGVGVAPDVAAALKLPAATKTERELKEELSMLVKACERQQKTLEKNEATISSLKDKIVELETALGGAVG